MSRMERRQQEELRKLWEKESKRAAKSRFSVKRVIVSALIVVLVLGGAAAASAWWYINSKLNLVEEVKFEADVENFADYDLSCVDVNGFVNILILGVDARDMNDDSESGEWRSDAIMIASIKEATGEVYLTSIYRDTFLLMGNQGFYDKITHAFSYGGVKETIVTVNKALDLNIKHYLIFNFNAAADVVDAMGGLELDIEEYEIEELNYYTEETWDIVGREGTPKLVTAPGTQLVDGCTAVSYGRIRKGVGDDYKRTERMRTLVAKMLGKVKTLNFRQINDALNVGLPQVKTNLSNGDIMGLAFKALDFNIVGTSSFPYNIMDGYVNDISYIFPTDLYNDVATLHADYFGQKDYKPSDTVVDISSSIMTYYGGAQEAPSENYEEWDGEGYGGTSTWEETTYEEPAPTYEAPPQETTYEESVQTYEEPAAEETTYEEPVTEDSTYTEPAVEETVEEPSYEQGTEEGGGEGEDGG